MSLVHDDGGFEDLLAIVAADRKVPVALVEKDYWVTHTLWALKHAGLELWFKGGTSLSKGFDLIERFSEDLDLRIEPGAIGGLAPITSWKSEGTKAVRARREYFTTLATKIAVPGARVEVDETAIDDRWFSVQLRVSYPGRHLAQLGPFVPFVRLELGNARVTPFVERDMTSFVHEHLTRIGQLGGLTDNQPKAIRCVHPLVTLIEKLDAIERRHEKGKEPSSYVRHYEDAARIVRSVRSLDPLVGYEDVSLLVEEMLREKQIAERPSTTAPGLTPTASDRWETVRKAHDAIGPMFWGPRTSLEACCEVIRQWIADELG